MLSWRYGRGMILMRVRRPLEITAYINRLSFTHQITYIRPFRLPSSGSHLELPTGYSTTNAKALPGLIVCFWLLAEMFCVSLRANSGPFAPILVITLDSLLAPLDLTMQLVCTAANSIRTPFYLPRFLYPPEVKVRPIQFHSSFLILQSYKEFCNFQCRIS
jgi:hypothetical protein